VTLMIYITAPFKKTPGSLIINVEYSE